MATYTNHYNLEKPAQTDIYNVDVFNANADKADAALYGKSDSSNIATVESSNVASKNYVVGELLVLNGILYSVTNAIATGGTITPDSNCTNTNVGNEIKTVKESLSTTETGTIATYSYGRITYAYKAITHEAHLRWSGNSEVPPVNSINLPLPEKLLPKIGCEAIAPLYQGGYIEATRGTNNCNISFGTSPKGWMAGSIRYWTD